MEPRIKTLEEILEEKRRGGSQAAPAKSSPLVRKSHSLPPGPSLLSEGRTHDHNEHEAKRSRLPDESSSPASGERDAKAKCRPVAPMRSSLHARCVRLSLPHCFRATAKLTFVAALHVLIRRECAPSSRSKSDCLKIDGHDAMCFVFSEQEGRTRDRIPCCSRLRSVPQYRPPQTATRPSAAHPALSSRLWQLSHSSLGKRAQPDLAAAPGVLAARFLVRQARAGPAAHWAVPMNNRRRSTMCLRGTVTG
jgi:hypothetical protein